MGGFGRLSKGAARYAKARLADPEGKSRLAAVRLAVCRTCSDRYVESGVGYCGRPAWQRDPLAAEPGCGCLLEVKAGSSDEHCPRSASDSGSRVPASCDCLWCDASQEHERATWT